MGPIENHREREKGVLIYPVFSRRSGGLSIGVNLFPGQKRCSFNCPYCEVFPFSTNTEFSGYRMEEDLRVAVSAALERNVPVKDICFSGNGEPLLSSAFPEALERAGRVRTEMVPAAKLVLITNGTGLLQPQLFSLLRDAVFFEDATAGSPALNIWLKLDAGTSRWYEQINRASIPFEEHIAKIKEFTACVPVTLQIMLCAIDGKSPPPDEALAWEQLVLELAAITIEDKTSGCIQKIQIYGKARSAPEDPKAAALPPEYLEERASSLRRALAAAALNPPVEVFL